MSFEFWFSVKNTSVIATLPKQTNKQTNEKEITKFQNVASHIA